MIVRSSPAQWDVNGSTADANPACATAAGIPHTTLHASSWVTTVPPAETTSRPPASPSCPMPVRITVRHGRPECADDTAQHRVDGGAAEILGRTLVQPNDVTGLLALDQHVAIAARQ